MLQKSYDLGLLKHELENDIKLKSSQLKYI